MKTRKSGFKVKGERGEKKEALPLQTPVQEVVVTEAGISTSKTFRGYLSYCVLGCAGVHFKVCFVQQRDALGTLCLSGRL